MDPVSVSRLKISGRGRDPAQRYDQKTTFLKKIDQNDPNWGQFSKNWTKLKKIILCVFLRVIRYADHEKSGFETGLL